MNVFVYDDTFDGLLTVVFDSFEMKIIPDKIVSESCYQSVMLSNIYNIKSDLNKADRVWKGLNKKLSRRACKMLYTSYLSKFEGIEMLLFEYIRLTITLPYSIEKNYKEHCVLKLKQINRKVMLETIRMIEFIRFQKTKDHIYFASVTPDYDVIRMIARHFKDRFADQKWVIYDLKREYGIYYDLENVSEIKIENCNINNKSGELNEEIKDEEQEVFELLWKEYYDSINIAARKNLKLMKQFMPQRYWKFMPEKTKLK